MCRLIIIIVSIQLLIIIVNCSTLFEDIQNAAKKAKNISKEKIQEKIQEKSRCAIGWQYFAASCYWKFPIRRTWLEARHECARFSSDLLVIDSDGEFDYIARNVSDVREDFFVGFHYVNDSWQWINSRALSEYTYYSTEELCEGRLPPEPRHRSCGILDRARRGRLCMNVDDCDRKLSFICEKVVDRCSIVHDICGKHGRCVNTDDGNHKCECHFLFSGLRCHKVSREGSQIITATILVCVALLIPIVLRRTYKLFKTKLIRTKQCHELNSANESPKSTDTQQTVIRSFPFHRHADRQSKTTRVLIHDTKDLNDFDDKNSIISSIKAISFRTFFHSTPCMLALSTIVISSLSLATIPFIQSRLNNFELDDINSTNTSIEEKIKSSQTFRNLNSTVNLLKKCRYFDNYMWQNLVSLPLAILVTLICSFLRKRETLCVNFCNGKPSLPIPFNLFDKRQRHLIAAIFGISTNEVLKILEEIIFKPNTKFHEGIIIELLKRIGIVLLVGMRYFPLLIAANIVHPLSYGLAFFYTLVDGGYTLAYESYCTGFSILRYSRALFPIKHEQYHINNIDILYSIFKNLPHFTLLSFVMIKFLFLFLQQLQKTCSHLFYTNEKLKEHQLSLVSSTLSTTLSKPDYQTKPEFNYTQGLLKTKESKNLYYNNIFTRPFSYIYQWHRYFTYSIQVLNTYTVVMILLYNLTCLLTFYGIYNAKTQLNNLRLLVLQHLNLNIEMGTSFINEILFCSVLAVLIYCVQVFNGMKKIQQHLLSAYKGVYNEIPPRHNFNNNELMCKCLHFSGYLCGYTAWGFIIFYKIAFFCCLILRLWITYDIQWFQRFLSFFLPVILIFLLKRILVSILSEFVFLQNFGKNNSLNNRRIFFLFNYFNFFFDCFLGVLSCIIRLAKAVLASVLFMGRLDYSFMGRNLERLDQGYATYVTFIHMEILHGHPILVTFCDLIWYDIQRKRRILENQKKKLSLNELIYENILQTKSKMYIFKWHLFYTLIRNNYLRYLRKNSLNNSTMTSDNSLIISTTTNDVHEAIVTYDHPPPLPPSSVKKSNYRYNFDYETNDIRIIYQHLKCLTSNVSQLKQKQNTTEQSKQEKPEPPQRRRHNAQESQYLSPRKHLLWPSQSLQQNKTFQYINYFVESRCTIVLFCRFFLPEKNMANSSRIFLPLVLWSETSPAISITAMYVSPTGEDLITGTYDGTIICWKIFFNDKQLIPRLMLIGHTSQVSFLVAPVTNSTQKLEQFISVSDIGEIKLWNESDGSCLEHVKTNLKHRAVKSFTYQLTNQNFLVCSGCYSEILIYDIKTLEIKYTLIPSHSDADWISTFFVFQKPNAPDVIIVIGLLDTGCVKLWAFDPRSLSSATSETSKDNQSIELKEHESKEIRCEFGSVIVPCSECQRMMLIIYSEGWQIFDGIDFTELCSYSNNQKTSKIKNDHWVNGYFPTHDIVILFTSNGYAHVFRLPENATFMNPKFRTQHNKNDMQTPQWLYCLSVGTESKLDCTPPYCCGSKSKQCVVYRGDSKGTISIWNMNFKQTDMEKRTDMHPSWTVSYQDIWKNSFENIFTLRKLLNSITPLRNIKKFTATCHLITLDKIALGTDTGQIVLISALKLVSALLIQEFDKENFEYQILNGHSQIVTCLIHPHSEYSRYDIQHLVSGSTDHSIRLWDLATGQNIHTFMVHCGSIIMFHIPPPMFNVKVQYCICSIASDHSVALVSLKERKTVLLANKQLYPITALRWRISDDFLLIKCADGSLYVWQIETGNLDRVAHGILSEELFQWYNDPQSVNSGANRTLSIDINESHYIQLARSSHSTDLMVSSRQNEYRLPFIFQQFNTDIGDDVSNLITFDLFQFVRQLDAVNKDTYNSTRSQTMSNALSRLSNLLVSLLHPWTFDSKTDQLCKDRLNLQQPYRYISYGVLSKNEHMAIILPTWQRYLSEIKKPTANLLISFVGMETEQKDEVQSGDQDEKALFSQREAWSKLLHFYCSDMVKQFQTKYYNSLSLEILCSHWQDLCLELRDASRKLLEEELDYLHSNTDEWQSFISKWSTLFNHSYNKDNGALYDAYIKDIFIDDYSRNEEKSRQLPAIILMGIIGSKYGQGVEAKQPVTPTTPPTVLSTIVNKGFALDNPETRTISRLLTSLLSSYNFDHIPAHSTLRRTAIDLIGRGYTVWEPHLDVALVLLTLLELCAATDSTTAQNVLSGVLTAKTDTCLTARSALNLIATARSNVVIITLSRELAKNVMTQQVQPPPLSISTSSSSTLTNLTNPNMTNPPIIKPEQKTEILRLMKILIEKTPHDVAELILEVTDITLNCIDLSTLRHKGPSAVSDTFSLLLRYPMVTYMQDPPKLCVGTKSGILAIYDLKTPKYQIQFSPDGKHLASYSAYEGILYFWQTTATTFFGSSTTIRLVSRHGANRLEKNLPGPMKKVDLDWLDNHTVRISDHNVASDVKTTYPVPLILDGLTIQSWNDYHLWNKTQISIVNNLNKLCKQDRQCDAEYGIGNIHLTNGYPRNQNEKSIVLSISADEPIIANKSYNYTSLLTGAIFQTKIDIEKNFNEWMYISSKHTKLQTSSNRTIKLVYIFIAIITCGALIGLIIYFFQKLRKRQYAKLLQCYTNGYKQSSSLPSSSNKHDEATALNKKLICTQDIISK
ncbi:unnamed protein product [Didymodactylos carnosus]|nr:unnamed protein product [Didymodactylos carnosus]CAF3710559.1 unnamed protein product [Didymodactylos carnosus]